mmetsp:Transcript_6759/g.8389  ORF Transcript_6759/g.8389 Transcript_6759/m.8389 type:complete len:281 (+) Transcript_6759:54-896(+)|eukprot:CAMPEP_0172484034 /NCGR_PEP_ID=MMETSP1066-20121228/11295_1 /TAXON_ID=671091 /ORGANISM="Coscinodiscus wailesii, Strain CCMP2513" /LENGTH=280 /DNA_ID=CAMNT_0013248283 /DNA_START=45 /DNA_END=887 /DNA_ORIENTATION=-
MEETKPPQSTDEDKDITMENVQMSSVQHSQDHLENDIDHEDPLLIAQTLTYITDDGSVVMSFVSTPFSFNFKLRFLVLEIIFVLLLVSAVPIGAHGTVLTVSIANMSAVAWFWYNSVRCVDITSDGGLRFWIGNVEIDVPFDKIVSMRRIAISSPCSIVSMPLLPHRGFLSNPIDGVAIITSLASNPFWAWPRSADKPERRCCFGAIGCPRLVIVFSPAGGGLNFIREVENEMRNSSDGDRPSTKQMQQPPSYAPSRISGVGSTSRGGKEVALTGDLFDV